MRRVKTWRDKYLKFEWNDQTKQFATHRKQWEKKYDCTISSRNEVWKHLGVAFAKNRKRRISPWLIVI